MEFDAKQQCLVLTMNHGKENALAQPLRQYLFDGIRQAQERRDVQWVLLRGNGQFFSAGADLADVDAGRASDAPNVAAVINAIEKSTKPVVALLSGSALGGGLDLALACHARLATASAKVGLPESKIGWIPGAGGTQRLPRAIGVDAAMDLMLSGKSVVASQFDGTALIQAVVPNTTLDVVLPIGQQVSSKGEKLLCDLPQPAGTAAATPKKIRFVRKMCGLTKAREGSQVHDIARFPSP